MDTDASVENDWIDRSREDLPNPRLDAFPGKGMRLLAGCLLAYMAMFSASASWGRDEKPAQQDSAVTEGLLNCDRQAESEAAQASQLSPVAPTSFLNPILLLNDLHRRKQEEANQPELLDRIEQKRQQCRKNVVAAATRQAQEVLNQKSDDARGYKPISFETFALDAKSLASKQARISMKGSYMPDGNFEWFFPSQMEAFNARNYPEQGRNAAKIPLLTEDASRDFRKFLLKCKSTPGANQMGCLTVITGHVSLCSVTGPLASGTSLPCIVVENGREIR